MRCKKFRLLSRQLLRCKSIYRFKTRFAVSKKPFGSFAPKDLYGLIFGPFRPSRKTTVNLLSLCLPFARELCFGPKSKADNRKNRPPFLLRQILPLLCSLAQRPPCRSVRAVIQPLRCKDFTLITLANKAIPFCRKGYYHALIIMTRDLTICYNFVINSCFLRGVM